MPGYLHHLAARITGTAPAVRPRLPSRFEPERAFGSVEAGTVFGEIGEIGEEIPASTTRPIGGRVEASQRPVAMGSERIGMPLQPRIAPGAAETESSPNVTSSNLRSGGELTPRVTRRPADQTSERSGAPLGQAKDPISWEEERPPAISRNSRNANRREMESEPAESARDGSSGHAFAGTTLTNLDTIAQELFARARRTEASDEKASSKPARYNGEAARERESRAEAPLAIAPTMTAPFTAPADAQRFETSTPKQDIHIVIGKITVQGATPAAKVALPPLPRPAPKMTLEQYLQERGSGR